MPETIETKFDITLLPDWAQRQPQVVWLCERNLGFRCDVQRADSDPVMHRHLVSAAKAVYYGPDKRDWPENAE